MALGAAARPGPGPCSASEAGTPATSDSWTAGSAGTASPQKMEKANRECDGGPCQIFNHGEAKQIFKQIRMRHSDSHPAFSEQGPAFLMQQPGSLRLQASSEAHEDRAELWLSLSLASFTMRGAGPGGAGSGAST